VNTSIALGSDGARLPDFDHDHCLSASVVVAMAPRLIIAPFGLKQLCFGGCFGRRRFASARPGDDAGSVRDSSSLLPVSQSTPGELSSSADPFPCLRSILFSKKIPTEPHDLSTFEWKVRRPASSRGVMIEAEYEGTQLCSFEHGLHFMHSGRSKMPDIDCRRTMQMQPIQERLALLACALFVFAGSARAGEVYVQTNLVSNGSVPNTVVDPHLQGAWGLSVATTGAFWISDQAVNDNGSGASSLISVSSSLPASPSNTTIPGLFVAVPNQGGAPPDSLQDNGPTGQVSTGAPGISTVASDFNIGATGKAAFIFGNLDGSISAWNGGKTATIEATVAGASFTGLAIGNLPGPGGAAQIYAADQNSGNIDVFNSKWQMTGSFSAPNFASLPAGYAAFNVQDLSVNGVQTLFVTYANQSTGGGIVDEFSTNGTFIKTLVSDTAGVNLNAPWGMAVAPVGWGQFGGDLLVANNNADGNGNTEINAYDLATGAWAGTLTLNTGQPFSETELWGLSFGTGASGGGSPNTLYFTAGLDNNTGGLFGAISVESVPEPSSAVLGLMALGMAVGCWRLKGRRRHFGTARAE
jgi:uncharacterized protein (TIGR03118 family)